MLSVQGRGIAQIYGTRNSAMVRMSDPVLIKNTDSCLLQDQLLSKQMEVVTWKLKSRRNKQL